MNFKLAVAICLGVLGSVAMASDSIAEVADIRSELMHSVVSADGFENNPYFTNDPSKDEEFFANAASMAAKSGVKNPTCSGVSSATDIYILDVSKDNLWCAYNDSIILKMSNTATNQGLDICKWRYITCTGGISNVYTLIYQGISGTTKYLYCQTTGTYDFCGKMVLSNPLEDWGQFWIRTSTYGIDTLKAYTINKYAADILGQLGTNINAQYFKTCIQSAINTC